MNSRFNLIVFIDRNILYLALGDFKNIDYLYKIESNGLEEAMKKNDPYLLAYLIREAVVIKQHKILSVSYIIANDHVVVRPIDLPRVNRNSLRENFVWEMCRHLPENEFNYYLDYQICRGNRKIHRILGAAAPRAIIDYYTQTSEILKYKLRYVDISMNTLWRLFRDIINKEAKNKKNIGVISFSANRSSILIIDNQRPFIEYEHEFNILYNSNGINFYEEEMDKLIAAFKGITTFFNKGRNERELETIFIIGIGNGNNPIGNFFKDLYGSKLIFINSVEQLGYRLNSGWIKLNFDLVASGDNTSQFEIKCPKPNFIDSGIKGGEHFGDSIIYRMAGLLCRKDRI